MILKGFKEKSNKKYINSILKKRKVTVNNSKIESLGVILNIDEINDLDKFRELATLINIRPNKLKIIAFTANPKMLQNSWDSFFSPKDFGWYGKLKNIELEAFLDQKFDALISFYNEDILELKFITACSNAKFKIGILQSDKRFNDFIIDIPSNSFELFQKELIKYLKTFNKI